ncbi:TPR repeat oca3 [Lecanosticta acicola]|uniref:ER membrane protein complex subunit 2 n=1 Tax=Lecanosticta acicola TaxID=111012 RepID=A0AAI9E9R8_9PEZI|nr:TPR repeat oca3 [Lecanosticta acicola]
MTSLLLQSPTSADPQTALRLSQQAPSFYKSQAAWSLPYPLSLLINNDSQEKWQAYENILLTCIRTGDDESAYLYLEELTDRFGQANERVTALRGLYVEATAKTDDELRAVMTHYESILKEDPTVFSIRKRRAALLRSMNKIPDAITALTNLLDTSPTDAEAWSELADIYMTQGLYEQAVFCLEEVLLITPNAWTMHAKLGEVLYLQAKAGEAGPEQLKGLSETMRRFCRSLELCDDYLRGYYGLKLTTNRLLDALSSTKKSQQVSSDPATGDLAPPSIESVTKLNELATAKLAEIVRRSASGEKGWDGYSPSELIAARELLDRDTQKIQR